MSNSGASNPVKKTESTEAKFSLHQSGSSEANRNATALHVDKDVFGEQESNFDLAMKP